MTDNPFLGTWRLISWENRDDKGQLGYPLGPEAVGYITYTADGYIFAQIMAAQRTPLATQNPFGGADAEAADRVPGSGVRARSVLRFPAG